MRDLKPRFEGDLAVLSDRFFPLPCLFLVERCLPFRGKMGKLPTLCYVPLCPYWSPYYYSGIGIEICQMVLTIPRFSACPIGWFPDFHPNWFRAPIMYQRECNKKRSLPPCSLGPLRSTENGKANSIMMISISLLSLLDHRRRRCGGCSCSSSVVAILDHHLGV